ncbi:hypothetical protein SSS_02794, partial [Sarcoptes scabiei]
KLKSSTFLRRSIASESFSVFTHLILSISIKNILRSILSGIRIRNLSDLIRMRLNLIHLILILFNLILLSGYCFNQTEPIEEIVDEPIAGGIEETSENQWKYLKPTLETVEREMDSQLDSPFVHRVGKLLNRNPRLLPVFVSISISISIKLIV